VADVSVFPHCGEHAVTGARHLLDKHFIDSAERVKEYLSQPEFVEKSLRKQSPAQQLEVVKDIHQSLVAARPASAEQCVAWARLLFQELFHDRILQLLHAFPPDSVSHDGNNALYPNAITEAMMSENGDG
jgi:ubiquitin-activating enzyme E1